VRLDAPTVTLVRNERGEWSFERLGSRPPPSPSSGGAGGSGGSTSGADTVPATSTFDVVEPRLAMNHGKLTVTREPKQTLGEADEAELGTSLSRVGSALAGQGELSIASLRIAQRAEVRSLTAPFRFEGGDVHLAPLHGQLANGTLGGQATVSVTGPTRYAISLDLRDGRAEALLATLGGQRLSGRLPAQASFTGTAEGATGQGHGEIRDGQLHDFPVLGAVAAALDLPLLRDQRFQEGVIDFVLAGNVLRTPVIRFISGDVKILGKGEVHLTT